MLCWYVIHYVIPYYDMILTKVKKDFSLPVPTRMKWINVTSREQHINQQMVTNLPRNKKDKNIFIVMKYDNIMIILTSDLNFIIIN